MNKRIGNMKLNTALFQRILFPTALWPTCYLVLTDSPVTLILS